MTNHPHNTRIYLLGMPIYIHPVIITIDICDSVIDWIMITDVVLFVSLFNFMIRQRFCG